LLIHTQGAVAAGHAAELLGATGAGPLDIEELIQTLKRFADERDWEQFHSPKNLAMALSVEAAELLEHFQWLTEEQSSSPESVNRAAVATEIADIQIYLAMIAGKLDIDIEKAVNAKIDSNAIKYPPSAGSASS
jgi:NTP pyrophosphatase (non-canonical NTP hydrolase)